jgi:hypothetical protein
MLRLDLATRVAMFSRPEQQPGRRCTDLTKREDDAARALHIGARDLNVQAPGARGR